MDNEWPIIEIRFTGEHIAPGRVRSSDIADLIISVEEMIASTVAQDNVELKKKDIAVGLAGIRSGSLGLVFVPYPPQPIFETLNKIAYSIGSKDFTVLPEDAQDAIRKIVGFVKKYRTSADFFVNIPNISVRITDDLIVSSPRISGVTVIYGQVLRIGNKKPTCRIKLLNEQIITCEIESKELAQRLAQRLYRVVGLSGRAEWNAQTLKLEDFQIQGITGYQDTPVDQALKELAEVMAPYYKDIEDPDRFVEELRYGDGDSE
ncbi:MAG: hypothetical protein HC914_10620 [Chloroflexaceae bacterium]|nr:hypothetical protein [Chloroflexaceae bacterium]